MEVRKVIANENVKDDIGKIALQRGPIMYCAEWIDNNGKTSNLFIPSATQFNYEYKAGLLNGVMVLKAEVPAVVIKGDTINTIKQSFTAIPYYSWANRGKGEMNVWFPRKMQV